MNKKAKIIFHIDLNAFYATCAMIKDPYLKDKVFVVGGPGNARRGVISTASYKARAVGVKSGMSLNQALEVYPKLLSVPADFPLYQKKSREFINFLKQYSSLVLQASIDEAYVDMTELAAQKHPLEIAKEIQDTLVKDYQLPCSIGIAPTLYLAKMGSDMKKPLGITVLRIRELSKTIWPLSIGSSFGIGKKTAAELNKIGVFTINDFLEEKNKEKILTKMSLKSYQGHLDEMTGKSSNIVNPDKYAIPQSISHETTLNYLIDEQEALVTHLRDLSERVYQRLKKYNLYYRTVGIKLKFDDFKSITRSHTFFDFQEDGFLIRSEAEALLEEHYDNKPVRLIGVFISNLITKEELEKNYDLFNYQKVTKKDDEIEKLIEKINHKQGKVVKKGIK